MIVPLLERASRRAEAADAVLKTDETVTLAFENGRLKSTGFAQESGVNLRVVVEGRLGFAGSTADDPEQVLEAAFSSARLGEVVSLELPRPAPLPRVITHYPRAASASMSALVQLGQLVIDRLSRDGSQVSATVERSVGTVRVANSRGVDVSYDVSSVTVSAELIRVAGDDVLIIADYLAGADLPDLSAIEAMVGGIARRYEWAARTVEAPVGNLAVCFTPGGNGALLLPLHQAFLGKSALQQVSPVADRLGEQMFSPGLTLTDAPLLDGRTGSRPADDEGTPSRELPLVEAGVPRNLIYDLETAARAQVAATGHGRRATFSKPQPAYSNLVVAPGDRGFSELLALISDGLLVDELLGVGQGNVIGGAFSHPVALAYRVSKGEILGRVTDVAVAGNAYELLARVAGVGREVQWIGSHAAPHLVVEGVAVARR